jgi:hypothetical protein
MEWSRMDNLVKFFFLSDLNKAFWWQVKDTTCLIPQGWITKEEKQVGVMEFTQYLINSFTKIRFLNRKVFSLKKFIKIMVQKLFALFLNYIRVQSTNEGSQETQLQCSQFE